MILRAFYAYRHSDDTDGRRGGLSLTSYFVDPRQPWDVSKGGQFVWCADPTAPVTIPPRYNTMVLFRVDDVTDHFIEPMLAGAAARLVYQVGASMTTSGPLF